MDCLSLMALKDVEILQYLDGEPLSLESQAHLKCCAECQSRLARYQQTETYLVSKLYRSECPAASQLNMYCADLLAVDEARRVVAHIAYCPLCYNDVEGIRDMLTTWEEADSKGSF